MWRGNLDCIYMVFIPQTFMHSMLVAGLNDIFEATCPFHEFLKGFEP